MNKLIERLQQLNDIPTSIDKDLLIVSLKELDVLIGMNEVKERVIEMVCETIISPLPTDTGNHCIVTGPPGVGKTTFINILAKIMFALGITQKLDHSPALTSKEKHIIHKISGIKFIEDQVEYILEELVQNSFNLTTDMGPAKDPNLLTRLKWIKEITSEIFESGNEFLAPITGTGIKPVPLIVRCSRADIIGQYQGYSASNMRAFYEKARGGVLVIDEAYSLMNTSDDTGGDNYGREAIDTLNQLMSEYPDTVVILGGYEDEIRKRLFEAQKGLESRIQHCFDIKPPNVESLALMLKQRLSDRCTASIHNVVDLLSSHKIDGYGRGIAKLAKQSSLASAKRRFFSDTEDSITLEDLMEGLKRLSPETATNPSLDYIYS